MAQNTKTLIISVVLLFALCLQVGFVSLDSKEAPHKAAIEFSKAYFGLNPAMADRLCADRQVSDDLNTVDLFLKQTAAEAAQRGFAIDYMRSKIYDLHTETELMEDQTAKVHISGHYRKSIHPAYYYVARIFQLGETYSFDQTLELVNETGQWKVCGQPYDLP